MLFLQVRTGTNGVHGKTESNKKRKMNQWKDYRHSEGKFSSCEKKP